jgi:MFS family permease
LATEPKSQIPRAWPFKRAYYGWAVVSASTIAAFGMAPMFGPVLGVFFTSIEEELGWDRATIALAFTIGSSTGSLFQMLIGRILDKYGARMIVTGAGILITIAMLGLWQMQEPWQFWVFFGVGRGAALAGIQIGTGVALSNWFIRKRGRVIAIRGVGQRAGQALMPMVIFGIMAIWGWREAFLILAGVTAVMIILPAALLIRRRPEDMGLTIENMDAEQLAALRSAGRGGGRGLARTVHDVSFTLAEARRTRAFWILLFYSIVDRFALGSLNLHMVANLEDQGLALGLAVSILSIFAATSALTGLPWGFVFEHLHVRYGAMLMSILYFLSVLVLLIADNYALALAFALLYGVATGAGNIVGNMLWADYFGRDNLGAIRGFGAPFRLLTPTGPVLTGVLYEMTDSYVVPFSIFGGIFVFMAVLMFFATPPVKPEPVAVADADAEAPAES